MPDFSHIVVGVVGDGEVIHFNETISTDGYSLYEPK